MVDREEHYSHVSGQAFLRRGYQRDGKAASVLRRGQGLRRRKMFTVDGHGEV